MNTFQVGDQVRMLRGSWKGEIGTVVGLRDYVSQSVEVVFPSDPTFRSVWEPTWMSPVSRVAPQVTPYKAWLLRRIAETERLLVLRKEAESFAECAELQVRLDVWNRALRAYRTTEGG